MEPAYKTTTRTNGVLVFIWDVLAFAGGAGVILAILHWLRSVLPIIDQLRLF